MRQQAYGKADLSGGIGRAPIIVSIILTLLGLLLVGFNYLNLRTSIERFEFAASDNVTWTVTQLQVDHQNLQLTLWRNLMIAEKGEPAHLDEIRRAFDIYYSRVDAVRFIRGSASTLRDEGSGTTLDLILLARNEMARELDSWAVPRSKAISALLTQVEQSSESVRKFTTQALEVLVQDASAERVAQLSKLQRYTVILMLAVGVLFGMLAVSFLLQSRLRTRASEISLMSNNLQRIIEASQDAVVVSDCSGVIREYNSAAEQIFGFAPSEAIGVKMEALFIPERYKKAHEDGMKHYVATGQGYIVNAGRQVMTACDKNGREFPVEVTIAAANDPANGHAFIGIMRDISSRVVNKRKLEVAVQSAKRDAMAKQHFLSVMSHEMRTPLQGVLATFDLLDDGSVSDGQRNLIDLGKLSGAKALERVNNTLELARLNENLPLSLIDIIEPATSLERLVSLIAPLLMQKGNTIEIRYHPNRNIAIYSNQRMFDAIFENLLSNANKFTTGGHLCIAMHVSRFSDSEADMSIKVQDNGIGISNDKIGGIFEEFATHHTSEMFAFKGTGLGLSIVKSAVENIGGQISVESELGEGSTFIFSGRFKTATFVETSLPDIQVSSHVLGEACNAPAFKPKVLVVDDIEINQVILGKMLERLGCQPDHANDGHAAILKCRDTAYDLILMDLNMPNMDGIQATHAIHKLEMKQGPIVCITAEPSGQALETVLNVGMVMLKPIRLFMLQQLLERLIFERKPGTRAPLRACSMPDVENGGIDLAQIKDLAEAVGHQQATNLLRQFELSFERDMADVHIELHSGNHGKAAKILHSIAGSAGMVGALALSHSLHRLEAAATSGDLTIDDSNLLACNRLCSEFMTATAMFKFAEATG